MKIVTVIGARPQFIKAASVSREIRNFKAHILHEVIVHTGQHYDYDMSEVFFKELDMPQPKYNLGIGSGSHGKQTGAMLEAIEDILLTERPDCVLLYGDTNSTLAGALAASKMRIPIAHVEAGLRSFNRGMPEEINRIVTDHVSTLLFCPTDTAMINLKNEGLIERAYKVGDVMLDSMLYYRSKIKDGPSIVKKLNLIPNRFVLATVHRSENTDCHQKLIEIFNAFNDISEQMPVLIALHPRTLKYVDKYKIHMSGGVKLLKPLSYLQMIEMECNAAVILTDSGGVQKEAFIVNTPCITLREETEWTETLEYGVNILCGTSKKKILDACNMFLNMKRQNNIGFQVYGEGKASEIIVKNLFANIGA